MRALTFLYLALPVLAHAATLRPAGTLAGPLVHLSDLWDDLAATPDRVLGPAPPPGGSITVPAAQLGAIATAYNVDWQPRSDADQAVLTRPGTPLPLDAVVAVLRPALRAHGAAAQAGATDPDFAISLPFFDPPMLDSAARPSLTLEQTEFDPATSRFTATLIVTAGAEPLRLHLAGSIEAAAAVLVPTRPLAPGTLLAATDVAVQRIPARLVTTEVATLPGQAIGLQLRRTLAPGQPIALADLIHPQIVTRHDRVMMALALPGLDLGAVGEAMQPGALGDRIAVRNPVSGAIVQAEITGPGQVRVDPGTAPVIPAPGAFAVATR